ncbi:MAG: hypothetical protein HW391_1430, partial [Chloroflexi bacterium]|nr:hypothetical protein [Chloroflexota bacterium]
MKTDGVATPVVPVLGTPRRRRTRAQVGLVAVFATIVLGAGIGLVGNGFTLPAPSPRLGATSTAGPSSGPSPSSLPSSAPTPSVLCTPVIAGSPPEIRVGRNAADASTVSGLAREGLPGPEASDPPPPAGWPVPPLERVLALDPRYVLRVSAVGEACLYAVLAEYAPADPSLEGPFPIALRTVSLVPAQSRLDLGVLPVGDWIVRVVASFARGPVGAEDGNQTERFFRVRNSEDDVPLPSPEIPPAVPCAALPAAAPAPELVLSGGSP